MKANLSSFDNFRTWSSERLVKLHLNHVRRSHHSWSSGPTSQWIGLTLCLVLGHSNCVFFANSARDRDTTAKEVHKCLLATQPQDKLKIRTSPLLKEIVLLPSKDYHLLPPSINDSPCPDCRTLVNLKSSLAREIKIQDLFDSFDVISMICSFHYGRYINKKSPLFSYWDWYELVIYP